MNQLTQKSQEALHDAQTKALRFGHSEVDGEHLLLALLDQPEGLAARLIPSGRPTRCGPMSNATLHRRPRFPAPAPRPGQVLVTQRLARLLDTAEREANRLKDDYVSVEHLAAGAGRGGLVHRRGPPAQGAPRDPGVVP